MISKETLLLAAEQFLLNEDIPELFDETWKVIGDTLVFWENNGECWADYPDGDICLALLLIAEAEQ